MKKYMLHAAMGCMLFVMNACESESPSAEAKETVENKEVEVNPQQAIHPDSIVVEVYEGHTHLKGDPPQVGDVFWSNTSNGFHADPTYPNYPMKAYQKMVLVKNSKGEYVPEAAGKSHFLVQTSPVKGGVVYAMVVRLYGEGGKRLDLDYKKEERLPHVQVFYRVKGMRPMEQKIPENVLPSDTVFTIDEIAQEDETVAAAMRKEGLPSKMSVGYRPRMEWTADTPEENVFYFFYQDKNSDLRSNKDYFQTPVGFRGVFLNQVPFVDYQVEVLVTDAPTGKPQSPVKSDAPTPQQLEHCALKFSLPFRNLYESRGWGSLTGEERVVKYVYEKETNYIRYDAVQRVYDNWNVYIPLLREFPMFTLKQLKDMFENDSLSGDREGADFWL